MARVLMGAWLNRGGMLVARVLFVALLLYGWDSYARSDPRHAFVVGTPSGTWDQLTSWVQDGYLWSHLGATAYVAAGGYLIAIVVGTTIGVAVGTIDWLNKIATPFLTFWNGFPRLVYYPFFALVLGFSVASRIALVVFVIIFIVIANTAAGVREVDRVVVDNMRVLGARPVDMIRSTYIPSAMVWIMTSARLTVGLALQGAIIAEFVGAQSGLGYLTTIGQNQFDTNVVWAATVVILVLAVVTDRALYLLQRHLTRWMPLRA
jgi:NitT/TauT family transport system permease protein